MPLILAVLLLSFLPEAAFVDLLCLLGADDADFVILTSKISTRVGYRVDVKLGSLWLARELS